METSAVLKGYVSEEFRAARTLAPEPAPIGTDDTSTDSQSVAVSEATGASCVCTVRFGKGCLVQAIDGKVRWRSPPERLSVGEPLNVIILPMNWLKRLFGGRGEPEAAQCVACESTELAQLAPDAYRCVGCGYEGGDGYAAYKEAQENASLTEQSTTAIIHLVRNELESLRFALVAVGGAVPRPSSGGVHVDVRVEVGGSLGAAVASADAEERARLRQEREMQLIEAGALVKKIGVLIGAMEGRPDAPGGIDELVAKARTLQVSEQTSNRQAQQMQTVCYELMDAL